MSIRFESNGSYVLGTRKHGNSWFGWLEMPNLGSMLEAITKGIEIGSSMLVKNLRIRAIVGHWYPIMSIDFHENAMIGMMALRQVWLFDLPMRGSLAKGWITQERGCWGTWKVSDYTEGGDQIL